MDLILRGVVGGIKTADNLVVTIVIAIQHTVRSTTAALWGTDTLI